MPTNNGSKVDIITHWFLLALAFIVGIAAILRVLLPSSMRLDEATLLYFSVAAALALLHQVKSLSFGSYKLEMIERIKEKQAKQQDDIEDIALIIPLLFPDTERKHLLNLAKGNTKEYIGRPTLRTELRRLRAIGLIKKLPGHNIGHMVDNMLFDLADYIELTDLGRRWAKKIQQLESCDN